SFERYADSLKHVRRALGGRKLQSIKPVDLAALYAHMARDQYAARTTKHVHTTMHKALAVAKGLELIKDNPADVEEPSPPMPERGEVTILQPDQAKRLLERLRGTSLYMIASLGLATGMRRNEMLGLRWRDVDFDAARATISQTLEQCVGGPIKTKGPKTRAG